MNLDEIFTRSIDDEFDQILIFGAGFDSRGTRLLPAERRTKLFELEVPYTQDAKIAHLQNQRIDIPENIVFISIDFNRESINDKLEDAGFQMDRRCLFILEGLIMYLDEAAVESLFQLIKEIGGQDSLVVFDTIYAAILREEHLFYGEEAIYDAVKNADEKWTFGIEADEIQSFLEKRDYHLLKQHNSTWKKYISPLKKEN